MIAFLLPYAFRYGGYLLAILGLVIALWGAEYKVNHWCNAACREARLERDEAQAAIKIAQARATELALLWSAQVDKTEQVAQQLEKARNDTFAALKDRARLLAAASTARLSAAAVSLSDDARSAASGQAAGAPAKPDEAAPAPAGSTEEFIVSLYEWAGTCRARVGEWEAFYASLRAAVPN